MSPAEITTEEEKFIQLALKYLKKSRSNGDEILATYRLTNYWGELVKKYEYGGKVYTHFWSKRGLELVVLIVKMYIDQHKTKKKFKK